MLKEIWELLFSSSKPKQLKRELYGLDNLDDDAIGYPANPIGIPVVQTRVLLERMQVEINKIKHEIGVDRLVFDEYILPVFEGFVRYADLLPASEYKHHATGGGLVSHSVDVAHRCMRAAQMTHFPVTNGSLTETQQSNMQWRVATVLAGLLHDSGKILADVQVHDGAAIVSERIVWDAQSGQTIHDWAADHQIERYFVSWNRDRHMKHLNASLVMLERLIPKKTLTWLENCYDGREIHAMMLAAVGNNNMSHPMQQIVAEADSKSVKTDMFSRNSHITKEIKRVPLSELFGDLIKHYLLTDKWKVNEKNAYVWFVGEQLYIVWNNAAPELVEEMIGAGYKIPSSPEVLARLMIEEGLAVANGDELFFEIYPEILGDAKKPVKIRVLKIRNIQRVVHEPEKLYSLKEHSKRPTKPVEQIEDTPQEQSQEAANQNIINELFDDDDDDELEPQYIRSKRGCESAQFTLNRIAQNMRAAMIERKKARQSEQLDTPAKPIQDKQPNPSSVQKLEATVQDEHQASPVNEPLTSQDHSKETINPLEENSSEIANFLLCHFEFDVSDGVVNVPSLNLTEVVLKASLEGKKWSLNDFYNAAGVVINE